MVDKKETAKKGTTISISLTSILLLIGGLEGWLALNSIEGIGIGCIIGFFIGFVCLVGFIPIVGPNYIYPAMISWLFTYIGFEMPIVNFIGLLLAWVYTVIALVVIILFIVAILMAISNS
jgi:hypothetical protein